MSCDWVIAGGFYIHWCAELEEFKRIRVLKEVENFAEIFFIDEGRVQLITDCRKLLHLSPESAKLPAQAIRAKLYGNILSLLEYEYFYFILICFLYFLQE